MVQIKLDNDLRGKLLDFAVPLEFVNDKGRVVARLEIVDEASEWVPLNGDISAEEIERRLKSDEPTYTTAEVIAFLEQL